MPMQTVEQVLQLYRDQYFDFNVQHFYEKLRDVHGIKLSYSWVKAALQTAGLVKQRKKPGSHRKRRPRRPLPGMMLHIDGSEHRWLGDDRRHELIVILDAWMFGGIYSEIRRWRRRLGRSFWMALRRRSSGMRGGGRCRITGWLGRCRW